MSLITVTEFQNAPRIQLPQQFTTQQLQDVIDRASASIAAYVGQPIEAQSNTDVYQLGERYAAIDRNGVLIVRTKHQPLNSVTSVESRLSAADAWSSINASSYSLANGCIHVTQPPFTRYGYGQIRAVYNAGYASAPADVKQACIIQASLWIQQQYFPSAGGKQILPDGLADEVMALLEAYRRRL